jgi:hypothetical protein
MKFRCYHCKNFENGICKILKEPLPNGFALSFWGGLVGKYGPDSNVEYPARCGRFNPINKEKGEEKKNLLKKETPKTES